MLSQYTWGQFFLFVGVVLVLYYLVVGFLYYRDDLTAVLKGKKPTAPQLAGAGGSTSAAGPPALVRVKSAFVASPTATATATESATGAATEAPEAGAAENLPEASAALVGGELPNSTATATGRDDSTDNEGPMDAASSVAGATDEAVALDADREEQADQPNEALVAIIRQKAHEMQPGQSLGNSNEKEENRVAPIAKNNTDETNIETKHTSIGVSTVELEIEYHSAVAASYEPLADFNEPVASPSDLTPVTDEELYEVDSVAAYIFQVQAGEKPPVPLALAGTDLAEQLARLTSTNTDELADLFGAESE